MSRRYQRAFSTVEVVVTLFVGSLFLISGHQLFLAVIERSGEARTMSTASNIAYDVLRREGGVYTAVSENCAAPQRTNISRTVSNLPQPVVITLSRCKPFPDLSLIKVITRVSYGSPTKEVVHATYLSS